MPRAKGIHHSSIIKLGKAPAKRDSRNFKLAAILKAPAPLPPEYDFDLQHPGTPTPMFANDQYGDCVMAGRAHQTLRFELVEQKKLIPITDQDVVREYLRESGGQDNGLVVLDSLRLWRKRGWLAAKDRYFIQAFAEIDRTTSNEVKRAIYLDLGVGLGLSLPLSAEKEIHAGKPWTTTSGSGSTKNSWGGHYVYVTGYTTTGPVCVTWGRKQQMSWAFFKKYCDEAYAMIDALNTKKKKTALDRAKLEFFLKKVTPVRRRVRRKIVRRRGRR